MLVQIEPEVPFRFRPIQQDDLAFLSELYASTRVEEMAQIVHWSKEEKQSFLEQQFRAQHSFYHERFVDAEFLVISLDEERIGRLYKEVRHDEIRIIDIALLPKFRNRGLGKRLMLGVLNEGQELNLPVRIHVEHNNPAMRLYDRLGFTKIGDTGVYFLMEWRGRKLTNSNG